MGRAESVAAYLRSRAHWRLDRVEPEDGGRNARGALALLDAAAYVAGLAEDDPALVALARVGAFGLDGQGDFDPVDESSRRLIDSWTSGDPAELLAALARPETISL